MVWKLPQSRNARCLWALSLVLWSLASIPALANNQTLSYSGRLTNAHGKPLDGPVDISVKFWTSTTGGTQLGPTVDFTGITLAQGVFQLNIALKPQQLTQVFGDGSTPVFVEVTAQGKVYPRQQFLATPFALRVPTDLKTLTYDSDGNLALSATSQPADGQFLTKDPGGSLVWATPSTSATQLNKRPLGNQVPTPGQALVFDGNNWAPQTIAAGNSNSVTTISGTSPIYVSSGSSTPNIGMTAASSISAGYVTASDYVAFNSKQSSGNYITALSGDLTATGPGSAAATLAPTGVGAGSYAKVTVDAKGRVTAGTSLAASDIPALSAANITSGTLAAANGGTGTVATPTNGQLLIGNGSGFTLATVTGGTGINVVNASGAMTINATADASTKVTKTGDTMTGILNLPANGFVAGTTQLVLAGGNVGIGTTTPAGILHIAGVTTIHGAGEATAAPGAATIRGANATGSNIFGANLTIQASNGTGTGGSGAILFQTAPVGGTGATANTLATAMTIMPTGNVGIGSTTPRSALDVNGVALTKPAQSLASATIDFGLSNLATTSVNCQAMTLNNIKDGGTYSLVVTGATAATCSFTASGFTVKLPTGHVATTASKWTVYTFMALGSNLLVSWVPGF